MVRQVNKDYQSPLMEAYVKEVRILEEHLKYVIQIHFAWEEATNNTAEYEGLLAGLGVEVELGIKKLII